MGKSKFGVCTICLAQNDTVIDGICATCRRAGHKKNELDVNNDGVVDGKDATIASKVLTARRFQQTVKKK